jgi:hypothetical protein
LNVCIQIANKLGNLTKKTATFVGITGEEGEKWEGQKFLNDAPLFPDEM